MPGLHDIQKGIVTQRIQDSFQKSRRAEPVGTIKDWKGKKYQKGADGKWLPYSSKDTIQEDKKVKDLISSYGKKVGLTSSQIETLYSNIKRDHPKELHKINEDSIAEIAVDQYNIKGKEKRERDTKVSELYLEFPVLKKIKEISIEELEKLSLEKLTHLDDRLGSAWSKYVDKYSPKPSSEGNSLFSDMHWKIADVVRKEKQRQKDLKEEEGDNGSSHHNLRGALQDEDKDEY